MFFSFIIKGSANLGVSVGLNMQERLGGEPKKQNKCVVVAETLELEDKITSLNFIAKGDLVHCGCPPLQ